MTFGKRAAPYAGVLLLGSFACTPVDLNYCLQGDIDKDSKTAGLDMETFTEYKELGVFEPAYRKYQYNDSTLNKFTGEEIRNMSSFQINVDGQPEMVIDIHGDQHTISLCFEALAESRYMQMRPKYHLLQIFTKDGSVEFDVPLEVSKLR